MDETSSACEDLQYFEKRLTEVIKSMQPAATRWRCKFYSRIAYYLKSRPS
ncbi:unnamed protein product [Enterobius vermicularis]|uniref:Transmembrane protein 188 n=1 Tax=Enterobius vermicularis TaxID=51028 RepID=A0A0N4VID7_ENTVE|nr:unnamed protein product [Enterobius vermicularis]